MFGVEVTAAHLWLEAPSAPRTFHYEECLFFQGVFDFTMASEFHSLGT